MNRHRTLPPVMQAPTHLHPEGVRCFVGTDAAIHTVQLEEGNFAAIVNSLEGKNGSIAAMIVILDRDEVEEHIRLLRNAMDDAERLDKGLPPLHCTNPGGTVQ